MSEKASMLVALEKLDNARSCVTDATTKKEEKHPEAKFSLLDRVRVRGYVAQGVVTRRWWWDGTGISPEMNVPMWRYDVAMVNLGVEPEKVLVVACDEERLWPWERRPEPKFKVGQKVTDEWEIGAGEECGPCKKSDRCSGWCREFNQKILLGGSIGNLQRKRCKECLEKWPGEGMTP